MTPEGRYNNYMKLAKKLIEDGMDAEKVANMPIHFFLEIVSSKVESKKKAKKKQKALQIFFKERRLVYGEPNR